MEENLKHIEHLILSELNIKELVILKDTGKLVKNIKPNFKTIGPKYGKHMKAISNMVNSFGTDEIAQIEKNKGWVGVFNGQEIQLDLLDFEISTQDIPGWLVASEDGLTVALDITISKNLEQEGLARELINRIQNLRKESGLEVTDRINIEFNASKEISEAFINHKNYICEEVLANTLSNSPFRNTMHKIELNDNEVHLEMTVLQKMK